MRSPPSSLRNSLVVISDLVEGFSDFPHSQSPGDGFFPASGDVTEEPVVGGYLERLPRAAVRAGLVSQAEIWHHHRGSDIRVLPETPGLIRRAFPIIDVASPFHSEAMIEFIHAHGAPKILCVWGLGVSEALLEACADSTIIYNSIDVPALRVPPEVSRHFDLVLTGAEWQSQEVRARHPGMPAMVLPVGPDFASPETFFPLDEPKRYDVIYVAAAQGYKRHDLLLDALQRSSRPLTALCVMGYGEDGEQLRREAAERGLSVDFVGPPGVSHAEVNRLMNQARVGMVCGIDDGAPAILTEYMLAGLPVVANSALRCGLQYILPETGLTAPPDALEIGIHKALDRSDFKPRQTVLERWAWPHSIAKLAAMIDGIPHSSTLKARHRMPDLVKGLA